jgi:hypothetical protein
MPAGSVGEEISHLVRDKGYPQRRAVAAALNMKRRGKMRKKRRGKRRY